MTAEKKNASGIRSTYDIVMERLRKHEGDAVPLTTAKKAALADADNATRAKVAELEILYQKKIAEAADAEKADALRTELKDRTDKTRRDGDAKKEAIRKENT